MCAFVFNIQQINMKFISLIKKFPHVADVFNIKQASLLLRMNNIDDKMCDRDK